MYYRVQKKPFLRKTRKGVFIIVGDQFYEVDNDTVELIELCDGTHTLESIVDEMSGSATRGTVLDSLQQIEQEGIIATTEQPSSIEGEAFEDERYPTSINVELTYRCNMSCAHCLLGTSLHADAILSTSNLLSVLQSMRELNIGLVTLTGGEPLLVEGLLLRALDRCKEDHVKVALLTNGYLVNANRARLLSEAGLASVQISLDSPNPEVHDQIRGRRGAFKHAINAAECFLAAGIKDIAFAMTLSRKNFGDLEAFLKLSSSAKVVPRIAPIFAIGRGKNGKLMLTTPQLVELYSFTHQSKDGTLSARIVPEERCSVGTSPFVAPSGEIYACMHLRFPGFILGNIAERSIRQIWDQSALLRSLRDRDKHKNPECRGCWNKYLCTACMAETYSLRHTFDGRNTYRCSAQKQTTLNLLKRGEPNTREAVRQLLDGVPD